MNAMSMYGSTYFILVGLSILNVVAMQVAIISYVKLYVQNNKVTPTIEEVWAEFKNYFIKTVFYLIPIYLLIILGLVFCLIPGIYLGVSLAVFSVVIIVEDETFSGAYSRCFKLIKDNFWTSFGIYIVVYIIYAVAAMIVSSVMAVVSGLLSYFTTRDIATTIGIAGSILNIFSNFFYIILFVSIILHYFNLTELKDGVGIQERLNKLGEANSDFDNIKEQY